MSNTEILRIHCRSCKRTGYVHNIPDSTHDISDALTSPLTLGCRGLFPRCVKRTGHEAGGSLPTSADVKNEWRPTSTPPIFLHGVVLNQVHGQTRRPITVSSNSAAGGMGETPRASKHCIKNDSMCVILNYNTGSHVSAQLFYDMFSQQQKPLEYGKKQNQLGPVYVKDTTTSTSSCNKRRSIPTTNQRNCESVVSTRKSTFKYSF